MNLAPTFLKSVMARYQNTRLGRQTVLPLATRIGTSLAQWLLPQFGAGVHLVIDTDRIEALASDCSALWGRVTAAPFLTLNEKREAVGHAPLNRGDRFE